MDKKEDITESQEILKFLKKLSFEQGDYLTLARKLSSRLKQLFRSFLFCFITVSEDFDVEDYEYEVEYASPREFGLVFNIFPRKGDIEQNQFFNQFIKVFIRPTGIFPVNQYKEDTEDGKQLLKWDKVFEYFKDSKRSKNFLKHFVQFGLHKDWENMLILYDKFKLDVLFTDIREIEGYFEPYFKIEEQPKKEAKKMINGYNIFLRFIINELENMVRSM